VSSFTFDNEIDEQNYHPKGDDINKFLQVHFRKSNIVVSTERNYPNVAALLAYIGGFWAILYRGMKFFARSINRISFEKDVADSIYHFEPNQAEEI